MYIEGMLENTFLGCAVEEEDVLKDVFESTLLRQKSSPTFSQQHIPCGCVCLPLHGKASVCPVDRLYVHPPPPERTPNLVGLFW